MSRSQEILSKNQLVEMSLALVANGENAPLTMIVRMSPLQTAKKITGGVMLLALPSGVGPGTMQALLNGRSISHSPRNP